MTEEMMAAFRDLIDGQEKLMDLVEQLAADVETKPGRGARMAAIAPDLASHREAIGRAKTHMKRFF